MTILIATALFLFIAIFPAAAQQFVISTYAGGNAAIGSPQGVAADTAGNVYFSSLNSVFKLDPAGGVTRVAGNLRAAFPANEKTIREYIENQKWDEDEEGFKITEPSEP